MPLTSLALLTLLLTATVVTPAAFAVLWSRRRTARSRAGLLLSRAAGLITCQLLAVTTLFVAVNDQYLFYACWNDLFGVTASAPPQIATGGLVSGGTGRVRVITAATPTVPYNQLLVWFPPVRPGRVRQHPVPGDSGAARAALAAADHVQALRLRRYRHC